MIMVAEEAMADITSLNFDKDGALAGEPPVVGAEITNVVLIAHGWNEGSESAKGHYRDLVDPLEEILARNVAQWQGHTAAYFGVIWPSAKYADDLTVNNMRAELGGPPPVGIVAGEPTPTSLIDAGSLEAHARDVAQFLGIDPDLLATQALRAAGDEGDRDAFVSTLQNATADRHQSLADEQTKAEYGVAFTDTGSHLFSAIHRDRQHLSANAAEVPNNPFIDWLKQLRGDANAIISQILNLFAYNEMKIRAGVVGRGLAAHVLNPVLANRKRVHLVGHSFGGRLMTAATAAVEGKISNLTLLEGAFSHNALSSDPVGPINGAFRSVIDSAKVAGRIVAAHSNNDTAVWIAYPLATPCRSG